MSVGVRTVRNRRNLSALADPLHLADRNAELSSDGLFRLHPPGLAQLSNVVGGDSQLFGHLAYSEVACHRYHLSSSVVALPPRGTLRSCCSGIELASVTRLTQRLCHRASAAASSGVWISFCFLAPRSQHRGRPRAFGFLFAFWPLGRSIAVGLGQLDDDEPVSPGRRKDEAAR